MPSLVPPDDESIKTLYVGGLDARVTEQDLKDHFYARGEIESIRLVPQRACAFVAYTTREGAEKAAEDLSNKLIVKGLCLKLMWGKPQAPKPETEVQDGEAARQGLLTNGGMLPRLLYHYNRAMIRSNHPAHRSNNNHCLTSTSLLHLNQKGHYTRQWIVKRVGALVPSQEATDSKTGTEKQPQQGQPQVPEGSSGYPYRLPPPVQYGQYPQFYPPYGYMPLPPPAYQHQYPYPTMAPPPPPPAAQQYSASTAPASNSQSQN